MSLINEALKKAQRQRSLDAAPLSAAPSGIAAAAVATHERVATHRRGGLGLLWFGLIIMLVGAGAAVLVMRYGFESDATPSAKRAPASSAAPTPLLAATPRPLPVASPPEPVDPTASVAPSSAPLIQLPSLRNPAPAAVSAEVPAPAAPVTAPQIAVVPEAPAPVPVVAVIPSPVQTDAAVYEFLSSARITGIRGVGAEARVLMNERVYRLNDIVSPGLGLRLSAVRPGMMVFTDARGKTFDKPY